MSLQIRRGTDADRLNIVFDIAEIIYCTDSKLVYIGDGATLGGVPVGSVGSTGNAIFTTESEPVTATEGDGWYQPSSKLFKIYVSGAFLSIKVDLADVAVTINDGFF